MAHQQRHTFTCSAQPTAKHWPTSSHLTQERDLDSSLASKLMAANQQQQLAAALLLATATATANKTPTTTTTATEQQQSRIQSLLSEIHQLPEINRRPANQLNQAQENKLKFMNEDSNDDDHHHHRSGNFCQENECRDKRPIDHLNEQPIDTATYLDSNQEQPAEHSMDQDQIRADQRDTNQQASETRKDDSTFETDYQVQETALNLSLSHSGNGRDKSPENYRASRRRGEANQNDEILMARLEQQPLNCIDIDSFRGSNSYIQSGIHLDQHSLSINTPVRSPSLSNEEQAMRLNSLATTAAHLDVIARDASILPLANSLQQTRIQHHNLPQLSTGIPKLAAGNSSIAFSLPHSPSTSTSSASSTSSTLAGGWSSSADSLAASCSPDNATNLSSPLSAAGFLASQRHLNQLRGHQLIHNNLFLNHKPLFLSNQHEQLQNQHRNQNHGMIKSRALCHEQGLNLNELGPVHKTDSDDLQRIRNFIEQFKARRGALGLTQKQAAQCFRAYTNDRFAFSDNFVGHFEGFQFRPQTAMTIADSLADWLEFAEAETRNGKQLAFMPGKVKETRKRKYEVIRIRDSAKRILVEAFEKNKSPSTSELDLLSKRTNIPSRNIEIFFKNRRTSRQYHQ